MSEFKRIGTQAIGDLIDARANDGVPITCILYTLLLPWVFEIARAKRLSSVFLWPQPATVLDIYHYYFNGHSDDFKRCNNDPSYVLELPGLPSLTGRDIPSFVSSSNVYDTVLQTLQEQLKALYEEPNSVALCNTFDALEPEAMKSSGKTKLIGIGPLNPDTNLDKSKDSLSLFNTEDYIVWLNSKPKASVIYVSFGSLAILSERQIEEITHGLLDTNRPFLWVIRKDQNLKEVDVVSTRRNEIRERGMTVPWCSQLKVLSHPSIGCFLSHCGSNSTMETLVHGVPVVGFPQLGDQRTNAMLIEDVWKIGVRVVPNEEGIAERHEIKRCLDLVMGNDEVLGFSNGQKILKF